MQWVVKCRMARSGVVGDTNAHGVVMEIDVVLFRKREDYRQMTMRIVLDT